jgi:hypothetical protein
MWKNIVERGRPQMTICGMHIECWIIGCVIFITFPLQQCLHERASTLRYRYLACIAISAFYFLEFVRHVCENESRELQSPVGPVLEGLILGEKEVGRFLGNRDPSSSDPWVVRTILGRLHHSIFHCNRYSSALLVL